LHGKPYFLPESDGDANIFSQSREAAKIAKEKRTINITKTYLKNKILELRVKIYPLSRWRETTTWM